MLGNSEFYQTIMDSTILSPYITVHDELQVHNREEENYTESAHMNDKKNIEWRERDKF